MCAKLDRIAIKALQAGRNLSDAQLNAYENAMEKGVVPSGSTGKSGIKFDHQAWVIKLTISDAQAAGLDNVLSPMVQTPQPDDTNDAIYLNFNQLTARH